MTLLTKQAPTRWWLGGLILLLTTPAWAQDGAAKVDGVNSGDTAWLLLSAALVMLMTPALALFYGGLVRRKNILSVLMQCFMVLCLLSVQWVIAGYSLSFSPDAGGHGLIGGLSWLGLSGVGTDPGPYAEHVPHQAFMIYQMMFAVITPGLIIGAFAERMRFSAFCVFALLWSTLVYDPVAHWVWGKGGFLAAWGALDFAGGTVVHVNAGLAALAAALVLGKRQGFPQKISPPHNLPFAVLGAALLWFGWFGFNGGSALSSGRLSTTAFVATHIAAAAAGVAWALLDWLKHKRPTMLGMITGAVAGLVAITPAAGFVTPMGGMWIGGLAGLICWVSVTFVKTKFGYDDSLDAFGVHGIGGIWGALATGIWCTTEVNSGGANGLIASGSFHQLGVQAAAVGITIVYAFVVSLALLLAVNLFLKLRVSDHDERVGLDVTQHREVGYTLID